MQWSDYADKWKRAICHIELRSARQLKSHTRKSQRKLFGNISLHFPCHCRSQLYMNHQIQWPCSKVEFIQALFTSLTWMDTCHDLGLWGRPSRAEWQLQSLGLQLSAPHGSGTLLNQSQGRKPLRQSPELRESLFFPSRQQSYEKLWHREGVWEKGFFLSQGARLRGAVEERNPSFCRREWAGIGLAG